MTILPAQPKCILAFHETLQLAHRALLHARPCQQCVLPRVLFMVYTP